ncbi:hypothetical protein SAMN05444000_103192 [Shimia gijangensis]|uniref:Uncharacterized protein n=1 Tax=Shimia gijangensis TaxID=1470563 RepID=A0A1M6EFH1_9RHOB|nr:hypothetical protein [Shimia gijangensis]SHI84070.1 hypothetical protein SAMN05444000_103192 [Shimia gijangensis]
MRVLQGNRSFSQVVLGTILCLSVSIPSVGIGEGNAHSPSTYVSTQIVDMDCKELKALVKRLTKSRDRTQDEMSREKASVAKFKSKIKESNQTIHRLDAEAKKTKDSKKLRQIERKKDSAQRKLDRNLKNLRDFESIYDHSKRSLKVLNNDLRIAQKTSKNKKCK